MAVEISKLDMARLHLGVPQPELEGILRPITANDTGRYERTGFAEPVSMQIAPAQFTRTRLPEPAYLPEQWSALTHPEGQLYFCRFGSPVVVTEAYLYRRDILDKVLQWVKKIEAIAAQRNFPLSDRIELFIKLEEDDCAYYFVDHTTRAQTWMENSDTDELGLPPVVSVSQLGLLCEELYWSHVEHFPMHIGGLPREVLDSLICVFMHAICDQMTSRVSTFPYSKQECEGFVSLLRNSRDHLTDGHITCTVARLWSLICRNRYLTQYGEEFARLSRDQSVLYDPETKNKWVSTVASRLSFGTSDKYLAQLDDVFVDHLVYSEQWKLLMTRCLREWRGETSGAFFGLMLHIFFLSQPSCSSLVVTSASLFGASILGSTFLVHRYAPLEGITAAQAMDYLESIQSPSLGFQCVALMFALPHALNLWGTLAIFANAIYMLATFFGTMSAAALAAVALLAFVLFQWTTSENFNISLAGFRANFNIPFLRNNVDDVSYTSVV